MSTYHDHPTRKLLLLAVILLASTLSARLHAEEKSNIELTTHGDDYGYKFDDDGLLGTTLSNAGDIFKGRKRFQRVMLLRPRTDLRPELYKCVENI